MQRSISAFTRVFDALRRCTGERACICCGNLSPEAAHHAARAARYAASGARGPRSAPSHGADPMGTGRPHGNVAAPVASLQLKVVVAISNFPSISARNVWKHLGRTRRFFHGLSDGRGTRQATYRRHPEARVCFARVSFLSSFELASARTESNSNATNGTALFNKARHARACSGHPRPGFTYADRRTSPGMTKRGFVFKLLARA